MKFLVIGLGSMGKRRIRNLQALNYDEIAGFDIRKDRLNEARNKYGIETFSNVHEALECFSPDIFIISTSPQHHMEYAYLAKEHQLSAFIEASVVDAQKILALSNSIKNASSLILPSCTMLFFKGPRKIKELLLKEKKIGQLLSITYHTGQYLPDWHPWESIQDFYVSNPETGGCREIVPFELTWLNAYFGEPKVINACKRKLSNLNIDIDDYYNTLLQYPNGLMLNLTVEVLSRPDASRKMYIVGDQGACVWEEQRLKYRGVDDAHWVICSLEEGHKESGYINPEEPYIQEMNAFVNAVKSHDASMYPNTLERDYAILNLLNTIEKVAL